VTAYLAVNTQLCTGCRTCMLACSFVSHGVFYPSKSYIVIEGNEEAGTFDIKFTAQCIPCEVCAKYCAYDALVYIEREQIAE